MRTILSLICVLSISCASLAQTAQSSWANLKGLKVGQKIQVVEMNSTKHSGTFLAVSDSAISIQDAAGEKSVPLAEVRSVKLNGTNRRLRHTLIGLGVGAAGGAVIGAATVPSGGFISAKGIAAAILGTAGAICGATIGVLLPTHDSVYSAASH